MCTCNGARFLEEQLDSLLCQTLTPTEILIFDDSLSALDTETEENILQNIEKDIKSCTSIIITHRESSAKRADFILNLSDLDTIETS